MIEETAIVTRCEGEQAWVKAQRKTACGQCQVNKGCGTAVLASVVGQKASHMRVLNSVQAREGETVVIGLHESAMLSGSLAVYLVPLLSLFLFAVTGKVLAEQLMISAVEGVSILFAVIGMLLAIVWLRAFNRRIANDSRYQPVILQRLPSSGLTAASSIHAVTPEP
ncbi:SoxR reducing system RseC family protein [Thiohalophilus sp.]|uniref:SoxR reducing system RseC family protein n=1 Tax=Thiohalophilus sp. TaxID=3028392 RepID=UPI002ACDFA1B|nr:SoxR reducing system RseC family protein [Thiohalophilus sp.]MDZ7805080.1 SoxR reducing system RseC family protein [Thiohalophilus sp.]